MEAYDKLQVHRFLAALVKHKGEELETGFLESLGFKWVRHLVSVARSRGYVIWTRRQKRDGKMLCFYKFAGVRAGTLGVVDGVGRCPRCGGSLAEAGGAGG